VPFKAAQPRERTRDLRNYFASSAPNAPLKREIVESATLFTYYWPESKVTAALASKMGKQITLVEAKKMYEANPEKVAAEIKHYRELYKNDIDWPAFKVPDPKNPMTFGFRTFNDWFIRQLVDADRDRPMEKDTAAIVSPADAKLLILPNVSHDYYFLIKEHRFNLPEFLGGDRRLAQEYEGGVMMIFRLAPYDYHRYHVPLDAKALPERRLPGEYNSVSPGAFESGVRPLTSNLRTYHGLVPAGPMAAHANKMVLMVEVGAMAVASIVNFFKPEQILKKGDELGFFQFGGSTIVLLFKPGTITPHPQVVANTMAGFETAVKVRETVAHWN
jgi:phosphatidylserine decarboxylase